MSKILLFDNNAESAQHTFNLLQEFGYEVLIAKDSEEAISITNQYLPDIVIIDITVVQANNVSDICKSLKFYTQTNDIQILLLTPKNSTQDEVLAGADGYITKPFTGSILIATINAHLRIKKLLDILYTNNSELAKSLYQLNVLYNTSSQFAGTLDKNKVIKIMNTGLEKSLQYSLCTILILNETKPRLTINSSHKLSEELIEAIKYRTIENYINYTGENLNYLTPSNLLIEIHHKSDQAEIGLDLLKQESLFSSITVADKPFGAVEILRENDFSGEDITCFQTVVKQVSLPLESALLYEEIKEKNIKLEKLEKMKSEFISIVSHELRTPLTAIKSSIDIILSGRTGDISNSQDKFLSTARRNVDRLSTIINDLLDLSKIEAGKMEFRFSLLDITEPLNHVISTFKPLSDTKNIVIKNNFNNKEFPKVYGDCSKLEQVFSNLISNAIKFTDDNGQITLSIEVVNIEDIDKSFFIKTSTNSPGKNKKDLKGVFLKISIQDSGVGIAKEDISKVFDKFQQIESSLSRKVGGTGLGLAIAKELVDAHRGEIWVESHLTQGSCFSLILPIAKENNIFILDLDNKLQQAKQKHASLTLLTLKIKEDQAKYIMAEIYNKIVNMCRKDDQSNIIIENDIMKIALSNTNKVDAEMIVKRIRAKLNDINNISLSDLHMGIAVYPDEAIETEELIELSYKNLSSIFKIENQN